MKRMLINATQQEELRMAMVDGQRLFDLNIELPAGERKKANIYKGKITRIEPSLEAAFVEFGADRHGFLPLKEISSEYFVKKVDSGKPNIRDVLKEGQDIVVQIDKEERGNKGAALTTFVSLAGRFIVLKPNKARSGGVSRRIVGSDRDLARQSLNDVVIPDGMSVILRTAGIDRSAEELAWDLENLLTIWTAILNVVLERKSPFLIYRESNSVVRALRDYLSADIGEILIDDELTYKEACEFVEQVMPHNLKKLKRYEDPVPLFTRYQIESQIESAFTHSVNLPSGGSIVIDHTEALVSIDINSARATKGSDIEATALNTNLEAADEVARQLRIRDLGGLIVIDFIDMGPQKNQRDVENRLRDAVRQDRARVQIGKISRFGLLEMSRQRLRPSLGESSYLTCPRCSGIGTIRSVESLALAILRIIGEEARKERTAKVIAQLPVEVATYLLNEKRDWVQSLESRNEMQVVLVANPALETPHYDVRRVRDDQTDLPENTGSSYELTDADVEPESPQAILERKEIEPAAIAVMKPTKVVPKRQKESKGLIASIMGLFSGGDEKPKPKKQQQSRRRSSSSQDTRSRGGQRSRRRPDKRSDEDNRGGSKKKRSKKTASKKKTTKEQPRKQTEAEDKQQQSDTPKPSRNRRSRGGRRRRRGGGEGPATEQTEQQQASPDAPNETAPVETPANAPAQTENTTAAKKPARKRPAKKKAAKKEDVGAKVDVGAASAATEAKPDVKPDTKPDTKPDAKPAAKSDTKPVADDGPPKVRTDDERATDAARKTQALSETQPKMPVPVAAPEPEKRPAKEVKKPVVSSDTSGNGSSAPEPKAESKPAPEAKPEPKPKAESKPESKPAPEAKPEPKPKAEPKPAPEVKPEPKPKPEGSLLPWDD
jgi:ribonuclease E